MKIAIVGGGISGCTAYLQLHKHLPDPKPEITIYEAYDTNIDTTPEARVRAYENTHGDGGDGSATHSSTLIVGGGLGVGPNGLNVLRRLDGDIVRDVVSGGYMISHQDLKTKNGGLLMRLDTRSDPEVEVKGSGSGEGSGEGNGGVYMLGTSRHSLWRNIRMRVPDCDIQTRRVSRVVSVPDGRNVVYFADGGPSVEADLVIGADGVKGVTKGALFPEGEGERYKPEYQGLVGIGGFIPSSDVKDLVEKGSMSLVFSGNGFFGYFFSNSAPSAKNRDSVYHVTEPGESLAWWSTYAVDECPDPKTLDMDAVARQLRERHAHWRDPVIRKVLHALEVRSMYPTWTSAPLPVWEKDGVVLVGDAAHALPPTSGQGASQALEDVEAFSMLLGDSLRGALSSTASSSDLGVLECKTAITAAAKRYMELRQPHVQKILESAQRMQSGKRDIGAVAEYGMYCAMWIAGFFPRLVSSPLKAIYNYNVAAEVEALLKDS